MFGVITPSIHLETIQMLLGC